MARVSLFSGPDCWTGLLDNYLNLNIIMLKLLTLAKNFNDEYNDCYSWLHSMNGIGGI